jgi:hypothetical protein
LSEIVFPQSQIGESKVQFTQVFVPINYNLNVNNKYKIEICAGNNICDKSDGVFLIESTPIATCTDSDGGKDYFKK